MKFRSVVLLFIIGALLVAWFTKPGKEDFQKYLEANEAAISSPPVIDYTNGYVYSMFTVSYFDIKQVASENKKTGEAKAIAVPFKKTKYLGLFGKFWKMD